MKEFDDISLFFNPEYRWSNRSSWPRNSKDASDEIRDSEFSLFTVL